MSRAIVTLTYSFGQRDASAFWWCVELQRFDLELGCWDGVLMFLVVSEVSVCCGIDIDMIRIHSLIKV